MQLPQELAYRVPKCLHAAYRSVGMLRTKVLACRVLKCWHAAYQGVVMTEMGIHEVEQHIVYTFIHGLLNALSQCNTPVWHAQRTKVRQISYHLLHSAEEKIQNLSFFHYLCLNQ